MMAIALKNGVLFFDLKRNQWISNSLQNEDQIEITDFSVWFPHYLSIHSLSVIPTILSSKSLNL